MADQRFFHKKGPFTLGQLAALTETSLSDTSAADRVMVDVAALDSAQPDQVSFLDNKKYAAHFRITKAGACFVRPDTVDAAPAGTICLISKNPYRAYALAAHAFYPPVAVASFRAPTAVIDGSAVIADDCFIGHGAVIGPHVTIGARCRIEARAVIESGVTIGEGTTIGANTYVTHALIGNRVTIYPGAVIGRPGFGFAMDSSGFISVPQLGRVVIEDDVEIGANTTIDRGAGPDTVIGQGSRIDNLVQIGHNVQMGRNCVIVAQSGISGSTRLGDFVMIGGQAGLAGHLTVAPGTKIAAQSGIMRSTEPGAELMGSPAVPIKQFMRQVAILSKMSARKGE